MIKTRHMPVSTDQYLRYLNLFFPDLFLVVKQDGEIEYFSGYHVRFFSRTYDTLIGKNLEALLPASARNTFFKTVQNTALKKAVDPFEYSFQGSHGERIIEVRIFPAEESRNLIVLRDITKRTRSEDLATSLETVKSFGYIFSGMRHEIGNPLNSIRMTMGVLKKNLDIYSREDILTYIERVVGEVNRLANLLQSLKKFTVYDRMDIRNVSMPKFLTNFLDFINQEITDKNISLHTRLPEEPLYGLIDKRAFQQVFLNVVENSIEALRQTREPEILIRLSGNDSAVVVQIRDNGCGMSEEQMENIFRPFYSTKPDGIGFGLIQTKKILLMMKGDIKIKSSKDLGTKVTIQIPKGSDANE